jgi:hypothetical protein
MKHKCGCVTKRDKKSAIHIYPCKTHNTYVWGWIAFQHDDDHPTENHDATIIVFIITILIAILCFEMWLYSLTRCSA